MGKYLDFRRNFSKFSHELGHNSVNSNSNQTKFALKDTPTGHHSPAKFHQNRTRFDRVIVKIAVSRKLQQIERSNRASEQLAGRLGYKKSLTTTRLFLEIEQ